MGRATWALMAGAAAVLAALPAVAATLPPIVESQAVSPQSPAAPPGAASAGAVSRPQSLDDRVARLERQLENQTLVEMYTQLEGLQRQMQELRGAVEEQIHVMQGVEQRQREIYLDFDRRIRQLETQLAGAQQPQLSSASPGSPASPSLDVPEPQTEQATYQQAVDTLRAGRNQESIALLQDFLARYPDSQYAGNAQYWLGEANYVSKRYPEAIVEFEKVVKLYPGSGKVPDAMLKLGYSQYELGQVDKAGATLNAIIEEFPRSTAAQLAQNRLQRMKR